MESGAIVVNEVNRYNNEKLKDLKKRKYFESFPPGYRFRPEDSELIVHYLKKKVRFVELPPNKFQEVNLYRYNPKQLIANHPIQGEKETEWYFLTPRERKYKNGLRPNRAAGDGYWKATGADKSIIDNGTTVGFRKALVFYKGKPPDGKKTNWIMHEFRDNEPPQLKNDENDMKLDDWVLCRVYKKEDKKKKQDKNNGKGELVGNPEANSQYVHGNEENSELVLVNEENSKHVHANAEISQHVHVNEFVEMNYDYNGIMGDSNGFMSIFNNDYWQLPFQYEPQGIQQFVAPQLHDFQTGLLQDTIPQQFAAPPINYRPPLIQPSETTLQSECLQEEKPTEIKEDMGSHTDNEYFDLDGLELYFSSPKDSVSLDSMSTPSNTPKQSPK